MEYADAVCHYNLPLIVVDRAFCSNTLERIITNLIIILFCSACHVCALLAETNVIRGARLSHTGIHAHTSKWRPRHPRQNLYRHTCRSLRLVLPLAANTGFPRLPQNKRTTPRCSNFYTSGRAAVCAVAASTILYLQYIRSNVYHRRDYTNIISNN